MINIVKDDDTLILEDETLDKQIKITNIGENYIIDYETKKKDKKHSIIVNEVEDETLCEIIRDFFDRTYTEIITENNPNKNKFYGIELGSQPKLVYESDINFDKLKIIKLNQIGYKLVLEGDFVVISGTSPYKEISENYTDLFKDMEIMAKKKVK